MIRNALYLLALIGSSALCSSSGPRKPIRQRLTLRPWATALPPELISQYVRSATGLDEAADNEVTRLRVIKCARESVAECATASDSAAIFRAVNEALFERLGVRYDPKTTRVPNQHPSESLLLGAATCTGLSLLLLMAMRGLGIPARIAGTPGWGTAEAEVGRAGLSFEGGNHNWVEAFVSESDGDAPTEDGGIAVWQWRYLGASEASPLDSTWFTERLLTSSQSRGATRVWASRAGGGADTPLSTAVFFPLVWQQDSTAVPAVERTGYYSQPTRACICTAGISRRLALHSLRVVIAEVELRVALLVVYMYASSVSEFPF